MKKSLCVIFGISLILNLLFMSLAVYENHEKIYYKVINKLNKTKRIPGRWRKIEANKSQSSPEQKSKIKEIESLGYLSGYELAPETKNVTKYVSDKVYNGLNLYCSGHKAEVILMDMEGNELHKWSYDIEDNKPTRKVLDVYFRRAHLYENGDLLAIYGPIGLFKLDKNSNLIWKYSCRAHHDMFVSHDGKIYILTNEVKINPKYNSTQPILEDYIVVLDSDGHKIQQVSVLTCLENSYYAPILKKITGSRDILHTNTIEVLNDKLIHKSSAFKKGNALISIRELDFICIIDMNDARVVWGLTDLWDAQHQPTVLENGNMLIFDNRGDNGKSRILEFDPFTQKIIWSYTNTSDGPFYSDMCGSSIRLPNGNTLITESDSGRAFEVTPSKEIVWEFISPYRAGKDNELIATLFEMVRLNPDFPMNWLEKKSDKTK